MLQPKKINTVDLTHRDDKHPFKQITQSLVNSIETLYIKARNKEDIALQPVWDQSGHLIQYLKFNRSSLRYVLFNNQSEYTLASHSMQTAVLTAFLGLHSLQDPMQLHMLVAAACLHDIGLTQIPEDILYKRNTLTNHEQRFIRKHPILGHQTVLYSTNHPLSGLREMIAAIIIQEHERNGGIGYPYQLTTHQIHMLSSFLAICDTYESLIHGRPWRQFIHPTMAIKKLIELDKRYFNSVYVRKFINSLTVFPIGTTVVLNDGRTAEVIDVHTNDLNHPKIRIINNEHSGTETIDLQQNHDLCVTQVIMPE